MSIKKLYHKDKTTEDTESTRLRFTTPWQAD